MSKNLESRNHVLMLSAMIRADELFQKSNRECDNLHISHNIANDRLSKRDIVLNPCIKFRKKAITDIIQSDVVSKFIMENPRFHSIIDLGCGNGYTLYLLHLYLKAITAEEKLGMKNSLGIELFDKYLESSPSYYTAGMDLKKGDIWDHIDDVKNHTIIYCYLPFLTKNENSKHSPYKLMEAVMKAASHHTLFIMPGFPLSWDIIKEKMCDSFGGKFLKVPNEHKVTMFVKLPFKE